MRPIHHFQMLMLAAVWGASFLFLKIAAPAVGPVAVAAFRVTLAALVLLPFALPHMKWSGIKPLIPTMALSGLLSCVLPFIGLSEAARSLPAGLLSILNATTPLWGALVGWAWAKEHLTRERALGLAMGFGGIAWLSWAHGHTDGPSSWFAIALALGSTLMYALAVHHSRRHLFHLKPIVVTTSCLVTASLVLIGPALWLGPTPTPSDTASMVGHISPAWAAVSWPVWAALTALGVFCTAAAYLLFFRLIGEIGASRALTVTFLIPIFGLIWGWLFFNEPIAWDMLVCTGVVFAGTALSNRGA